MPNAYANIGFTPHMRDEQKRFGSADAERHNKIGQLRARIKTLESRLNETAALRQEDRHRE